MTFILENIFKDVADSAATGYNFQVGNTFRGILDGQSDEDRSSIESEGGETYNVNLGALVFDSGNGNAFEFLSNLVSILDSLLDSLYDLIFAGTGGDQIEEGTVIDMPDFSTDTTVLRGSIHDDILGSGSSDDSLYGGDGADTFVFAPQNGNDTIVDFSSGEDKIDLAAFMAIASVADLGLDQQESSLMIDLSPHDGGTITLQDFSGTLTDADFVFSMDQDPMAMA